MSSALKISCQFSACGASTRGKRLVCRAESESEASVQLPITRRAAALAVPVLGFLAVAPQKSWALLPDDDDADLIEKAKASRAKRIKAELATEKKYAKDAGFSKSDSPELVPVQKAVFELAKSGSDIESGNLSGLADSLSASWVGDFKNASAKLSSGNSDAESSASAIFSGIDSLGSAAKQGDMAGSKKEFVAVVSALQSWADTVGITGQIKGL